MKASLERTTVYAPKKIMAALKERAKKEKRSVTATILLAIESYLIK